MLKAAVFVFLFIDSTVFIFIPHVLHITSKYTGIPLRSWLFVTFLCTTSFLLEAAEISITLNKVPVQNKLISEMKHFKFCTIKRHEV